MHELSLAQSLIRTAAAHAKAHAKARITSLEVVVGSLAGVDPEALRFCFPIAARHTPCEGAALRLTLTNARGSCAGCGHAGEVTGWMDVCPRCGTWPLELQGGREMLLRSLELG